MHVYKGCKSSALSQDDITSISLDTNVSQCKKNLVYDLDSDHKSAIDIRQYHLPIWHNHLNIVLGK